MSNLPSLKSISQSDSATSSTSNKLCNQRLGTVLTVYTLRGDATYSNDEIIDQSCTFLIRPIPGKEQGTSYSKRATVNPRVRNPIQTRFQNRFPLRFCVHPRPCSWKDFHMFESEKYKINCDIRQCAPTESVTSFDTNLISHFIYVFVNK